VGRLLAPPVGEEGLKVDEARQVVALLQVVPVGMDIGVVVVGPLDLAGAGASDALLKTIEGFDDRFVQPILWAHDLGGVTRTIQSRSLARWAPEGDEDEEDDGLAEAGWSLVSASLEGDLWRIPGIVGGQKGKEYELLRSATDILYGQIDDERARKLWRAIRQVARHRNPTPIEVISAFLPQGL